MWLMILSYIPIALAGVAYGAIRRRKIICIKRVFELMVHYRSLVRGGASGQVLDEQGAWYTKPPLCWAHAGGAFPVLYGNSLENFDSAIKNGFRCLEVDVALTRDNLPVLSHLFMPNMEHQYVGIPDFASFMQHKICDRFTPLSLDLFVERYKDFDGYFFLDGLAFSKSRFDFLDYFKNRVPAGFAKKCIVQVIKFSDLQMLKGNDVFGGIHFNGISGIAERPIVRRLLINVLSACNVHSVSISDFEINSDIRSMVADFNKANIRVSIAGVNSLSHYKRMVSIGVSCIDTDYLMPSDLRNNT